MIYQRQNSKSKPVLANIEDELEEDDDAFSYEVRAINNQKSEQKDMGASYQYYFRGQDTP